MSQSRWTRGEFLRLGLGLVAVAVGCGDDESTNGASGPGGTGGGSTTGSTSATSSTTTGGATTGAGGAGGTGSGSGGAGGSAALCTGAVVAAISANHGHELTIPLADIEAGVDKTYDATGSAGHCHELTVTAADFATLKSGGVVTKSSCNGGDHEYVLSCAPGAPAPGAPDCAATPTLGACG